MHATGGSVVVEDGVEDGDVRHARQQRPRGAQRRQARAVVQRRQLGLLLQLARTTASSTRVGAQRRGPPWTTRCPTAATRSLPAAGSALPSSASAQSSAARWSGQARSERAVRPSSVSVLDGAIAADARDVAARDRALALVEQLVLERRAARVEDEQVAVGHVREPTTALGRVLVLARPRGVGPAVLA